MKSHEASWLRKSAATAFICALERYETWNRLLIEEKSKGEGANPVYVERWRALAETSWREVEATRDVHVVIDGLALDWSRPPERTRQTVGRASIWHLSDVYHKPFWPIELVEGNPPPTVPLRPFDECVRRRCDKCLFDGYLVRNQRDVGTFWPFSSCIEHRVFLACFRCRTLKDLTYGGA